MTEQPTSLNSKKTIVIIVGVLAFLLTSYFLKQTVFAPPSFDKLLKEAAVEINKDCPMMIDSLTRLDNTEASEGTFQYNYTLVKAVNGETALDTLWKNLNPSILKTIKTDPEMKVYRENKATLNYIYKDKNGVLLHKYSVTPAMYMK